MPIRPRPETIKESASSVSSTFNATLINSSFLQPVAQLTAGNELALGAASGEVLTRKFMFSVGSSTSSSGSAWGFFLVADGDADAILLSGNQDDIAGLSFIQLHPFQSWNPITWLILAFFGAPSGPFITTTVGPA